MSVRRQGAFSAGMLTLAVFLAPPLLSPGPLELANLAGVALAIWLAVDVWRVYGRDDRPDTLAYRVGPVAPGLIGSAALVFAVSIGYGWNLATRAASPSLVDLGATLKALWDFPLSPIRAFIEPGVYAPPISEETIRGVTLALSMAVASGLLFGLASLFGRVRGPETLRAHALRWAGLRAEAESLRERAPRVGNRLFMRFLSLLVSVVALAYLPAFYRVFTGFSAPSVQAFLETPLMTNMFFLVWFVGLWGAVIAGAIILAFAHLRLAFAAVGR